MKLIGALAYKWALAITEKFYFSNVTKRWYYYWFRLILGTIFKMAIIFGITYLLDVFKPTLYCALVYGVVKIISGGMHYRSFGRSILLSVMLFITMGVIADTFNYIFKPLDDVLGNGPNIYIWILCGISALLTILYVPVKVRQRVSFWKVRVWVYKILTLAFIAAAMYYSQELLNFKDPTIVINQNLAIVISIWTAIVFELIASVPIVYFGVSKLNQILNYK